MAELDHDTVILKLRSLSELGLYFLTVSRPVSAASVSLEHGITSCFYRLHCTLPSSEAAAYCFAARLSRCTSAYSLMVRYYLNSSRSVAGRRRRRRIWYGADFAMVMILEGSGRCPVGNANVRGGGKRPA